MASLSSPTRVFSSSHSVFCGAAAVIPGSGTTAAPTGARGTGGGAMAAALTFDGGAALVVAPGIIEGGITRVDSSSQLGIDAVGAEIPGSGTAPGRGALLPPGRGTAAV